MLAAALLPSLPGAHADEVVAAVAANFAAAMAHLEPAFEQASGHQLTVVLGSSGKLVTQIQQGAPFDVLLSADVERPELLAKTGLGVPGSRFTYAIGRLALWSRDARRVDGRGAVLSKGGFDKLAIADPKVAPYGVATVETLRNLGLHEKLQPKLVQGASIAQTFQFIETGAAEVGFVALSQLVGNRGGSRWIVPAKLHGPIDQQAVQLKVGAANSAARAFMAYLKSGEAKAIIRRYGYEIR